MQVGEVMKTLLMILMMVAFPVMAQKAGDARGWDVPYEQLQQEQEAFMTQSQGEVNGTVWIGLILLWVVIFGALGMWLGEMRGRAREGAIFGAMFGPLGLVIACLMPEKKAETRSNAPAPKVEAKPKAATPPRRNMDRDDGTVPTYKL